MGTLYVMEPETLLSKDGGVLKVSKPRTREVLLERPLIHVSEVVILGNTTITPLALYSLIDQGSSVHYLTRGGRYFGQFVPLENRNVPLRIKQYEAYLHPDRKHCIAQSFVQGKIQNACTFARRHGADIKELQNLKNQIQYVTDTEALRGLEGNAARIYFSLIRERFPEGFNFENRNKRPPRDEVNSLLSLAYTFLAKEAQNALRIAGLDPYIGYLHEAKYGKPALALDLMEEFRSIIADSVVLTLLNRNMIDHEHFHQPEGFPSLTDDGFKQFLRGWEDRMGHKTKHPLLGQNLDYRQTLVAQARILGKHLMGELETYLPFTVR